MAKVGDWVVIRKYNNVMDSKEGRVVSAATGQYSGTVYLEVMLESGRKLECNTHQVIVTKEKVNLYWLIEEALRTGDKAWFKEIVSKVNDRFEYKPDYPVWR